MPRAERSAFAVVMTLLMSTTLFAPACLATKNSGPDGSSCSSGDDCKSKACREGQCGGSSCHPAGGTSSDCSEGWLCKHHEPDPISGFFGSSGSDSCSPTCGHCPEHWSCADGAKPGTICTYDYSWSYPKVVIDQPAHADGGAAVITPNQEVTFHATVSSPSNTDFKSVTWTFEDGPPVTGVEVKHTFPPRGHVEVTTVSVEAIDAQSRSGRATLAITLCGLANDTCDLGPNGEDTSCCGGLHCVTDQGNARCK
jgi:hypothetical protein